MASGGAWYRLNDQLGIVAPSCSPTPCAPRQQRRLERMLQLGSLLSPAEAPGRPCGRARGARGETFVEQPEVEGGEEEGQGQQE